MVVMHIPGIRACAGSYTYKYLIRTRYIILSCVLRRTRGHSVVIRPAERAEYAAACVPHTARKIHGRLRLSYRVIVRVRNCFKNRRTRRLSGLRAVSRTPRAVYLHSSGNVINACDSSWKKTRGTRRNYRPFCMYCDRLMTN